MSLYEEIFLMKVKIKFTKEEFFLLKTFIVSILLLLVWNSKKFELQELSYMNIKLTLLGSKKLINFIKLIVILETCSPSVFIKSLFKIYS